MIEFAYKNTLHASTSITPFTNYGFHPHFSYVVWLLRRHILTTRPCNKITIHWVHSALLRKSTSQLSILLFHHTTEFTMSSMHHFLSSTILPQFPEESSSPLMPTYERRKLVSCSRKCIFLSYSFDSLSSLSFASLKFLSLCLANYLGSSKKAVLDVSHEDYLKHHNCQSQQIHTLFIIALITTHHQ